MKESRFIKCIESNSFIKRIKILRNKKIFIYFIRLIGWIDVPITIHIGLFHEEIFDKYPILTLFCLLIFILLADYKVNYKDMTVLERVSRLLLHFGFCIFLGYVIYIIGCNFK